MLNLLKLKKMPNKKTVRDVAKLLQDKYFSYPDVFGVNVVNCNGCGGEYVEVYMNTHNRNLLSIIPSSMSGIRIEKVHQSKPVEQENLYVPYYTYPYLYTSVYGIPTYNISYPRHRAVFPRHGHRPHGGFRRR